MPSDAKMKTNPELIRRALDVVGPRIHAFQSAVAGAELAVREDVMRRSGWESFRSEQALVELGPLAVGRVDPERFSRLLGVGDAALTPEAVDVLDRVDAILAGLVSGPAPHLLRVGPGGDLRDTVKRALTAFGSAFGAARAAGLARAGSFDEEAHGHLLGGLPFRAWNRAERRLAPPLVVEVQGSDCMPVGLGEFLDGNLALVLVAVGPTTPAPLARLITPGTFVMQTASPDDLVRLVETEHPGIALLFDEDRPEQAWFVHDPEAGETPWERLSVTRMPEEAEVGRGRRAPAWLEEVAHLRALAQEPVTFTGPREAVTVSATAPAQGVGAAENGAGPEPADRLAAWLLARADTDGAGEMP